MHWSASERLWRLAFGAAPDQEVTPEHARLRETVLRVLQAEKLDEKYFPRRPTLMPQLLRAVKDPNVGSGALGSIIAQDPVLAGDTLRLANSSYYRVASKPIETIQRAVVMCGTDGLQSLIATALMQPVFRATDANFPRFPALLWERTARASRAAELYAARARREDRFEAQLVTLLNALGPLVVYRATLDTYARVSDLSPSAELCVTLIGSLGQKMSQRIARHWQSSARLVAALDPTTEDADAATDRSLTHALLRRVARHTVAALDRERVDLEGGYATCDRCRAAGGAGGQHLGAPAGRPPDRGHSAPWYRHCAVRRPIPASAPGWGRPPTLQGCFISM